MGVTGRVRARGREGKADARGRAACGTASTRASARAHALFGFVVHTMNAMSGAMQFSRRWTSVVVPVAMLIKYVFARII